MSNFKLNNLDVTSVNLILNGVAFNNIGTVRIVLNGATPVTVFSSAVQTATPTTATQATTSNSVTFRVTNTDSSPANISWQIRRSTQTGTLVNSGTSNNVASNASIFPNATGLISSTTH